MCYSQAKMSTSTAARRRWKSVECPTVAALMQPIYPQDW